MRTLVVAALLAIATHAGAAAATFQLPAGGKPAASVTIPDGWSSKVVDEGIEATSQDGTVSVAVDISTKALAEDEIAGGDLGEGTTIDPGSLAVTEGQINGMKAIFTGFDAKTKDGSVNFLITQAITPKPDVVVIMTFRGTTDTKKKHQAELDAISHSLKLLN